MAKQADGTGLTTETALTADEQEWRAELEAAIKENVVSVRGSITTIGASLRKLQDGRYYRSTHGTWNEYVFDVFGFSGNWAGKQIAHSEIIANLLQCADQKSGTIVPLLTEGATRELHGLSTDEQSEIITTVLESGEKVTAKTLAAARERRETEAEPEPAKPTAGTVKTAVKIALDCIGRPMPAHLVEVLTTGRNEQLQLSRAVSKLKTACVVMSHLPHGAGLSSSITGEFPHQYLGHAATAIAEEAPWTTCHKCNGREGAQCPTCKNRGWIKSRCQQTGQLMEQDQQYILSTIHASFAGRRPWQ